MPPLGYNIAQTKSATGNLSGTMEEQQAYSQLEAVQRQIAEALAGHTAQAQQAAAQARGAYQEAAQAPPPGFLPGDSFVPQILGALASVIGQNPQFSQQAEEQIGTRRGALAKARADNLQALHTNYVQKAQEAEQAGDFETATVARQKADLAAKNLELVSAVAERQHKTEEGEKVRREALKREAVDNVRGLMSNYITAGKPVPRNLMTRAIQLGIVNEGDLEGALKPTGSMGAGGTSGIDPEAPWMKERVTTIRDGRQFVDLSDFTGNTKNAAIKWAGEQGLPALGKDQVYELRDIEGARRNLDAVLGAAHQILPADAAERAARSPGIKLQALLQTNAKRAAFNAWRTSAIKALRATTGSKSFRMTQSEVNLAIKNDIPTIYDTYEVALEKFNTLNTLLDNAQEPLISRNWNKVQQAPQAGGKPQVTQAARDYAKSLGY